jgi:hypothetical protein
MTDTVLTDIILTGIHKDLIHIGDTPLLLTNGDGNFVLNVSREVIDGLQRLVVNLP